MTQTVEQFSEALRSAFPNAAVHVALPRGEVTLTVAAADWFQTNDALRKNFGFEQAVDICGVDHLGYGEDEWETDVSSQGFSRGVDALGPGRFKWGEFPTHTDAATGNERPDSVRGNRFQVVLQLLSLSNNQRLTVQCFCEDARMPVVDSLTAIWPGLNWFEREAFDMFGIIFTGHPDLRRILTDYGFVGHPFRKDFPLIGNVEVRYDAEKERVIYEPVTSVEPRVGVPRVIREDARIVTAIGESADLKVASRIGPAGAKQ